MESYRIVINRQKGKSLETVISPDGSENKIEGVMLSVSENTVSGVTSADIRIRLKYEEPFEEHKDLALEAPVRVFVPAEQPEKITAIYMFGPWWSRPAFTERFDEIPDRTQVALFKYKDRCGCMVPMVGDRFKTYLRGGTGTELCFEMTACTGGLDSVEEPLYAYAEAPTAAQAVHKAFDWVIRYKGILPREDRKIPEIFKYLGWCSWDAFYTDVSEELVRKKADEIIEKGVPFRWMLIDDGWFPSRDRMITDFAPDKAKFPEGFRRMIDEIKSRSAIRWFGVWHALGGYWDGVDPECRLAETEKDYLYRTRNNEMVPDYRCGSGFYRDWCRLLRSEGIDFIKVDGQSTAPFYYENEVPVAEAARGMNCALESGSFEMRGAIINCMGMAMENVLARPASAVSRNSDDFFPSREGSFTEHILENAYNSLYHDEIYCCDWDMFWSKHEYARKHSLLRAVSGGPVYVSDRIGETDPTVLAPLALCDGSLLMMARSAKPTEDCVFTDPVREGVLKLNNYAPWGDCGNAGGIAAFELTGADQTVSFTAGDIPELSKAESYWVLDYFGGKLSLLGAGETYTDEIKADGFAWYVVVPARKNASCLGLLDKYTGFIAVENIRETEDSLIAVICASGRIGWASRKTPSAVYINGIEMTDKVTCDGDLQYIDLPETKEKTILRIVW